MLIRSDGTDLKQLTNNSAADQLPSINHDGSLIAYMSNADGDDEIYVTNRDGTHTDQLTFNTVSDGHPSIDGTGNKVVYQSNIDDQDTEIFVVQRSSPTVGGIQVPIDMLGLLAPMILVSTTLVAIVATTVYVWCARCGKRDE
jgi:Tol biopolymer transport system component